MMHVDFAKELYETIESQWDDYDLETLKRVAAEKEFLAVAESCGDDKITSICATIREITKPFEKTYRKVTNSQRFALASFLLARFGSAKEVIARAYNTTVAELFEEEKKEEEKEFIDGIEMCTTHNVAFGK